MVRIGLIQATASKDVDANLRRAAALVKRAAKRGAKVVCLQELFRTTYFPVHESRNVANLAETIRGGSIALLAPLAAELGIVLIVPLFERHRGRFYNSAVVIDSDGAILGTYRKSHLPHDPFFYEQNYFEVGNTGYRVFKTQHLTFAVLICYDQWFPEAARVAALNGADIIFYPSAIGRASGESQSRAEMLDAWRTIQRSHSIANSVHVAVVNRVGTEGPIKFWGHSFVSDAFGTILKAAGSKEEILVVDVDIEQNARIRKDWGFIRNRRPDTYRMMTKMGK